MHAHAEVYLPPTAAEKVLPSKDIYSCLMVILDEYHEEEGDHGFYDWFVVGGRWSGEKSMAKLREEDPHSISALEAEVQERKLNWVGPNQSREEQDKNLKEAFLKHFPDYEGLPPVGRDTYYDNGYEDDIAKVKDIPDSLVAYTVIIVGEDLEVAKIVSSESFTGSINVKETLKEHGVYDEDGYLITVDYHN